MKTILDKQRAFSISYDMKETEEHSIDAEVLGESLISLTRTIRNAEKVLNGENSQVKVEVKAHKEGSFTVDLLTWYQSGGADVLNVLGFTAGGFSIASGTAFGVISQIKSQKIKAKVIKGKNAKIVLADDTEIECSKDVANLVSNQTIRQELSRVISTPLIHSNGAKFVIKDENHQILDVLELDDALSFKALPKKTLEEIEEQTDSVTIIFSQVNFDGPTGWRCELPNGDNISIRMRHEAFRNRINQGYETFVKGEPYIVKLTEKVTTKPDFTSVTRYYIDEVIRKK